MRGGRAFARGESDAVKGRQAIDLGMEQHPRKTGNGGAVALQGEAMPRKDFIP